jgi:two-component system, response regulator PdtaR
MSRAALPQSKHTVSAATVTGDGAKNSGLPIRILIVEDDFFVATALENHLQDAGYEVVGIAATAEEAIQIAGERAPALAIMDIRLAGPKDGVDTAIAISSLFQIPSIFATAHGDVETRRRAEKANPLGWVSKPYSNEAVVAAVRSALR